MSVMTDVLSDRRFLAAYEEMFPFNEDLDILQQSLYTIDDTRIKFLKEGIAGALQGAGRKARVKKNHKASSLMEHVERLPPEGAEQSTPQDKPQPLLDESVLGACAATVPTHSEIEMDSLISSVRDLLPDLGTGFIQLCLESFNLDVERVLNAILEDKLPPHLQEMDRTLPRDRLPQKSLMSERRNVYDDDEFDVFHKKDIDVSKVFKGKRQQIATKNYTPASAEDRLKLQPVYDLFGSVEAEGSVYAIKDDQDAMYEDEYDDTYDSNNEAEDEDSADELMQRRHNVSKTVNRNAQDGDEESEEDEGGEEEQQRRRDQFVEDPAKIRERQEQRRLSKMQRSAKKNVNQGQPRSYDVQGKPKGQGQSKDVVHNRDYKEKNKGRRANHNRRALADKKRGL